MMLSPLENFGAALRVVDDVWSAASAGGFLGDKSAPLRLPDIGFAAAAERSALGRTLLDRIAAVDADALPHDLPYTLEIARQIAERWSREEAWYWLVFDPLGGGFYAMFAPTAYCGGFLLNTYRPRFAGYSFRSAGDGDRYVGLVRDYGRLIRQMHERTAGQAERGIYMPRPQFEQAVPLIEGLRASTEALLTPDASRLTGVDGPSLLRQISAAIASDVMPAFDAFTNFLKNPAYAKNAPESVGISQYPGGGDVYAELVRLHTTLDLNPEQVHATGLARMADIRSQMRTLLDEAGFTGNPADYLEQIKNNPKWRASGAEDVGAVFRRYIDRIAPHIDATFNFKPKAPHGVAPLPDAFTDTMTFGYYTPPTPTDDHGRYVFNAPNLSQGPLNHIGALNYHELVPGHHFHLATQDENETLHPLRRKAFINAFNEGWAEYAATLAGEMGMYPEPEERFGRLMMDAFLTCRLVVDTGMNAFGWPLEQARDYMRENAFMPEKEIRSESVRYSSDIPGQALAYKLGDTVLYEAREKMRAALGNRFDLRDFHDAVLKPGALPLPLVQRHVEDQTRRIAAN
ncbi:uncharacterized protein (DUF885 family) [Sphingopyxis panaciterrae]|uniref:DUF885 domain-containing protein n=1 Tax=Sphingopyxis panaciterrae TaxID=363841 RepID=UPI00141E3861|nr:DUF885 domain-containing protein [Sphingopyxis panaciterrae]NIJ39478.1 uncharacterized protein (DUF885 family) [Sphingopyxis panaciterrae]